jgi:hypothetical protein
MEKFMRLERVSSVTIHTRAFGPIVLGRPRQSSGVNFFHPTDELFEVVYEWGRSIVVSEGRYQRSGNQCLFCNRQEARNAIPDNA